ncbi:hypothetical protein B0H21DRAFT_822706 [Amylocystis lapponica]|nr:hypothetical protein B0H21DRAFT_822706 [Amylocystis lapponica]
MDAMDINWCLTCNRHIDTEGTAPYCSRECFSYDKPSTSMLFIPTTPLDLHSLPESTSEADECDDCLQSAYDNVTGPGAWIGKGDAGICAWAQDIPPGPPSEPDHSTSTPSFRPPKLLLAHRRPIPPSLCMSKTIPAPPEPSRPILTPQQSLPSLMSQSTSDTLASYATPSSSLSIGTPISEADIHPAPPVPYKSTLMHALAAHFRSWAATPAPAHLPRETTVTRDASCMSVRRHSSHRPCSPSCACPLGDDWSSFTLADADAKSAKYVEEEPSCVPTTFGLREKVELLSHALDPLYFHRTSTDDHPAYRSRGRKMLRVVS